MFVLCLRSNIYCCKINKESEYVVLSSVFVHTYDDNKRKWNLFNILLKLGVEIAKRYPLTHTQTHTWIMYAVVFSVFILLLFLLFVIVIFTYVTSARLIVYHVYRCCSFLLQREKFTKSQNKTKHNINNNNNKPNISREMAINKSLIQYIRPSYAQTYIHTLTNARTHAHQDI